MKPFRFLAVAVACLGLAACYTSMEPLIGENAAAPHASITFIPDGDTEPVIFAREGNAYVTHGDEGTVWLHLLPVDGDFYVAQLTGPDPDETPRYLYSYMRLDAATNVADVWLTVGTEADVRAGLSMCDGIVCIDDLAAYIASGREKVAAGETPDTTFRIEVE